MKIIKLREERDNLEEQIADMEARLADIEAEIHDEKTRLIKEKFIINLDSYGDFYEGKDHNDIVTIMLVQSDNSSIIPVNVVTGNRWSNDVFHMGDVIKVEGLSDLRYIGRMKDYLKRWS